MRQTSKHTATENQPNTPGIRLAELILPLSLATDIATSEPLEKALRACLLAIRLGEKIGLSDSDLRDVYYLALLRHIGCTAGAHLVELVHDEEFIDQTRDVDFTDPMAIMGAIFRFGYKELPYFQRAAALASTFVAMIREGSELVSSQCEAGRLLAMQLGMSESVQTSLQQIFERWDGHGMPSGLKGENVLLITRIANLAHCMAVFHHLGGVEATITIARKWSGGPFDPFLTEHYCQNAAELCQGLETESLWNVVMDSEPKPPLRLSDEQIETATQAVADFVDLRTSYTVGHSSGVAYLAASAARWSNLPESDVTTVRQAAYLHDLGRVGIPIEIWNKAAPLTDGEWERVRLHPYYTERILARSKPLAPLASIGAAHHERLDGSGYHRGLLAVMLPPLARILAAADAYHAMTEPRPHRLAFSPETAAETVQAEARQGLLDAEAVKAVLTAAGHRVSSARRSWVSSLTDREVEVLRLLTRGLSNREIAQRLTISNQTAGHHIRHIYNKINVSTRAAATLYAMQHNLLASSDFSDPL